MKKQHAQYVPYISIFSWISYHWMFILLYPDSFESKKKFEDLQVRITDAKLVPNFLYIT